MNSLDYLTPEYADLLVLGSRLPEDGQASDAIYFRGQRAADLSKKNTYRDVAFSGGNSYWREQSGVTPITEAEVLYDVSINHGFVHPLGRVILEDTSTSTITNLANCEGFFRDSMALDLVTGNHHAKRTKFISNIAFPGVEVNLVGVRERPNQKEIAAEAARFAVTLFLANKAKVKPGEITRFADVEAEYKANPNRSFAFSLLGLRKAKV